jgi:hypothetical protein
LPNVVSFISGGWLREGSVNLEERLRINGNYGQVVEVGVRVNEA